MHAKLFSLDTAAANETAGERGIYLESEDFIVITQRGKPQLFKCYPLSPLKLLAIVIENVSPARWKDCYISNLSKWKQFNFEFKRSKPDALKSENLTCRSKNMKTC